MALPLKSEIAAAIGGLGLLLRGDGRALLAYDFSESGFWRSFRWPLLTLLAYVVLMRSDAMELAAWDGDALTLNILRGVEFLLAWFLYLAVMAGLSRAFGLGGRFAVFVVLYNWAQAITTAATLPLLAGTSFGLLGPGVLSGWSAALLLVWLYIVARIVRLGLGAGWSLAAAAAALDLSISILIHGLIGQLI